MDISNLLSGVIGNTVASTLAKKLYIDESKAKWIMTAAVPLIIAAINYNAKNKNQASSINNALDNHSGGILGNIAGLFSQDSEADGGKIIGHVFGNNAGFVTDNLSEKSGLSTGQVGSALAVLAPLVMGFLGQQKQAQSGGGGIGDLLGGLLGGGGQSSAGGGLLGSLVGSVLGGGKPAAQSNDGMGALADLAGQFFNQQNNSTQRGNALDSLAGLFGR